MKMLAVSLALLLGSCAQLDAAAVGVATYGAQAADRELSAAVWATCQAASVGAIRREFNTAARMKAYNAFCSTVQKRPDVELTK